MGKWVKDRLDSLSDIVAGGTPSTNVDAYWDGEIPFVTPYDLSKCAGVWIDKTARYITKAGLKNSAANLLPPQSIVISTRAPIGYIALTLEPSVSNQGCKSVVLKEGQDKVFHCYNLSAYVGEMKRLGVGTTFSEISKADLSRIKVCHPVSLVEQRHIAEILTTCDEVIEKSGAVVEKYRAIKAGMLKDLLTRGIGNNGKLRPPPESAPQLYKDTALGKVPREWEEKTIAEIGDVVTGSTPSRSDSANWGGDFNWISAQDFKDKYIYNAAEKVSDKGKRACHLLPLNSVLVTCIASIGLNAIAKVECATNQQINAVICEGCDYEYFYYLICFSDGKLKQLAGQTAVPIISKTDFQQLLMAYPSDFAEQQRIAERLSAIDAKIADELAVVAKYRKVKAGLMARLLTPPDMEVE